MNSGYLETISSRYLALESAMIHYVRTGEGPPLVLVHGGGMWLYSFRHNIPSLSRHFSVYALDLPGYGYSVPLDEGLVSGEGAIPKTLLGFIDRLGLEQVYLLGHSWGGGWALSFASRYPERVAGLVLVNSSGFDVPDVFEWELLKLPFIGSLLLRCVTVRGVRKRIEHSFHSRETVTDEMAREVYIPLTFRHNQRAQARIARGLSWKGTERAMPCITKPCLVVWGENDRYLDVDLCRRFQARLPDVRSHIIKECGHSAHEERPEEVNDLILSFFADTVARS